METPHGESWRIGLRLVTEHPHDTVRLFVPSGGGIKRCALCGHERDKPCICTGAHVMEPCPNHEQLGSLVDKIKHTTFNKFKEK